MQLLMLRSDGALMTLNSFWMKLFSGGRILYVMSQYTVRRISLHVSRITDLMMLLARSETASRAN